MEHGEIQTCLTKMSFSAEKRLVAIITDPKSTKETRESAKASLREMIRLWKEISAIRFDLGYRTKTPRHQELASDLDC
jgi:hypothetical protein